AATHRLAEFKEYCGAGTGRCGDSALRRCIGPIHEHTRARGAQVAEGTWQRERGGACEGECAVAAAYRANRAQSVGTCGCTALEMLFEAVPIGVTHCFAAGAVPHRPASAYRAIAFVLSNTRHSQRAFVTV